MQVYLCEKPSQARDIARNLGATTKKEGYMAGADVAVTWAYGHLLESAMPDAYLPDDVPTNKKGKKVWRMADLPVVPGAWQKHPRKEAKDQLKVIKGLVKSASEVVIATDADREGETIGREVLDHFGYKGPVRRLWLSALDDASIQKALDQILPGGRTEALYEAGLARDHADWLVGLNGTRAFTLTAGGGSLLSVGRVQTPTLKLIVDRDRTIEAFVPEDFFDVTATTSAGFDAKWLPQHSNRATGLDAENRCKQRPAAEAVAQAAEGGMLVVGAVETKRKRKNQPLPFSLSALQQAAGRKFGAGAQEVLNAAQRLYETHKVITYPRTDCGYLPQDQHGDAPGILAVLGKAGYAELVAGADSSIRSQAWNDKKVTAHHGIIPTGETPPELTGLDAQVFDLIARIYIAQFYPVHEFDATVAHLSGAEEWWKATGKQIAVVGWRAVFEAEDEDQPLPALAKDQQVAVTKAEVQDRQTSPPKAFTEATLVAAMEKVARFVEDPDARSRLKETSGLGTEATRAGIIETLTKRGYIEKKKGGKVVSTDAGRGLVDAVPVELTDPVVTAAWEDRLAAIAAGEADRVTFEQEQVQWVGQLVERAQALEPVTSQGSGGGSAPVEGVACPQCGGSMLERKSKHGPFYGCSGYPDCKGTLPKEDGKKKGGGSKKKGGGRKGGGKAAGH